MLSEIHASKNQPFFDTFAQVQPIVEGHIKAFLDACHPERGVEGAKDLAPDLINHHDLIDEKKKILEYNIKIRIPNWLDNLVAMPALLYRRIRFGYPFRRIPLTKGKFAIVDPDDYPRLKRHKWFATKNGSTFYAKRHTHTTERIKTGAVCMHRQIMKAPDNLLIDHINYNGLDNRKANLRLATRRQNSLHIIRTMNPGSSKYKGVSWREDRKKWSVKIMADGKTFHLGCYKDEIQAAKIYDKAAKIYHGDFAALNFPEKSLRGIRLRRTTKQSQNI